MSSILDALKKLEEEKAARQQTASHTIDQGEAEHDLMGPNPLGRALTRRLSPAVLVVGGLIFSVVLVAVSVGAAVYVAQSQMAGDDWMAASAPSEDDGAGQAVTGEEEPDDSSSADESKDTAPVVDDEPDVPEPTTEEAPREEPPQPEAIGAPPAPQEPESVMAEVETGSTPEEDTPSADPEPVATEVESESSDPVPQPEPEPEPEPEPRPEPEPEPEPETEPEEVERPELAQLERALEELRRETVAEHAETQSEEVERPELARLERALEELRRETAAERGETGPERLSSEVRQAEEAAAQLREQRAERARRAASPSEAPSSEREQQAPAPDDRPVDMDSLPTLTQTARREHGLEDLRINMLRAPSENRPRPSALIDYQVVYVGETIPGTNARLLAVSVRGIAIEVNGARYYVRR